MQFGAALVRDFCAHQSLWDNANHFAAGFQRAICHCAHQAQPSTAIDNANAAFGQRLSDFVRDVDIYGIFRGR